VNQVVSLAILNVLNHARPYARSLVHLFATHAQNLVQNLAQNLVNQNAEDHVLLHVQDHVLLNAIHVLQKDVIILIIMNFAAEMVSLFPLEIQACVC